MKTSDVSAGSLALLQRAMDLRSARHDLIAGNISNMDTPNYRSFDFAMTEALGRLDGEGQRGGRHAIGVQAFALAIRRAASSASAWGTGTSGVMPVPSQFVPVFGLIDVAFGM